MNDNAVGGEKCTPFSFDINGRKLTIIELKGILYFIAKEVGDFLGYSDKGARLVNKITQVWSKPNDEGIVEMQEGAYWLLLDGELLAMVKQLVPESGSSHPLDIESAPGRFPDYRPNRAVVNVYWLIRSLTFLPAMLGMAYWRVRVPKAPQNFHA